MKQVVYFELPDKILATMPKVGWHSIRSMGQKHFWPVLTDKQVSESELPLAVFIRHPYDRLVSVWAYHHNIIERDGRGKFPHGLPADITVEQFIDHVLDSPEDPDPHWHPQMKGLAKNPEIIIAFDHMTERWSEVFDAELPHMNASPGPKPDLAYRYADVLMAYEDDLVAWYNACHPEIIF